ncbi:hypothetical protein J5J86_06525 [Aquabacter sp. L1I39]|uniref:Y-family DNA polymerase n=1 Tax=Aquabacter sp. L1I39 TaxID=2820278 RepID=UPI001ADD554C|nr:DNA polymerase Y family protein [Aquabacter sp. L1I39]QTL04960.1 hypothetical protein J5J86_06525 [Aquabacter sp. L1I39]
MTTPRPSSPASPSPGRRYLALWLERLPTDRLERPLSPDQRALPRVTVSMEKSALRLAALNAPAAALGLGAGLSLADARARHPALVVEPHAPEADQKILEDLAEACARYTPLVALDGPDGLILDISGCAHLFGGEAGLARDLLARVASVGLSARAAIAATPGGAAALARFSGGRSLIVPEGTELGPLLAPLPLAALRLAPAVLASLARLGLTRIGDLLDKPRAPLAARFGADLMDRLDGALIGGRAALTYRFPPPRFSVDKALAEPVERVEDVLGLARHLAGSLAGLMERHGLGARRLDLALFRVDGKVTRLHVGTGRPLRDPALIQRLFAEKVAQLSSLDAGFGFDLIRLSAPLAEPMDARQDGFDAQREAEEAVDRLLDRLAARFGRAQVLVPACADAHMPEAAGRLVPAQDYARQAGAARAFRAPPVPAEGTPAPERATLGQGRPKEKAAPSAAGEGAGQGRLHGALPVCPENSLSAPATPPTPGRGGTASPFSLRPPSGPGETPPSLASRASPPAHGGDGGTSAIAPRRPGLHVVLTAGLEAAPPPPAFILSSGPGETPSPLAAGLAGLGEERPKGSPSAAGEGAVQGAVQTRLGNPPSAPAVPPPSGREERASRLASSPGLRPPMSNGRAASPPPRGGHPVARAARVEGMPDASRPDLSGPARPLRLLDYPEPAEAVAEVPDGPPLRFRWRRVTHLVLRAEGPERIAAPWWREDGLSPTRDYFRVETVEGHRFWLFRAGLYGTGPHLPAWYVHGQFG